MKLSQMAPKRRSCDCRCRRYHEVRECRDRLSHRRPTDPILHRVRPNRPINVAEIVYGFLGNVAIISAEDRQRRCRDNPLEQSYVRRPITQGRHLKSVMSRKPCKRITRKRRRAIPKRSGSARILRMSKTLRPRRTETASTIGEEPITPVTPAKSAINTTALMKKRSFYQVINNYIKAGIEEGKRRARKYMCKALSFGVDSGFLIPTDPDGQMLRVSSALVNFDTKQNKAKEDERGKRKKLRRGDEISNSQERKTLRRRRSSSWVSSSGRPSKESQLNKPKKRSRSRSPSVSISNPSNYCNPQLPTPDPTKRIKCNRQMKKNKAKKRTRKVRRRKVKRRGAPSATKVEEPDQDEENVSHNENDKDEIPKPAPLTPKKEEKAKTRVPKKDSDVEDISSEDEIKVEKKE